MVCADDKRDIQATVDRLQLDYYGAITHAMQQLQGYLTGIIADRRIRPQEIEGLQATMEAYEHLKGHWPYDEIESLLTAVMADGVLDVDEEQRLLAYFEQFSGTERLVIDPQIALAHIAAVNPEITFTGKSFCCTGACGAYRRRDILDLIRRRGGDPRDSITQDLDYLVIFDNGNACWSFSCYGRKIEKAVTYRKAGHPIHIIKEVDFWDALGVRPS
jgi:NAD-dependent DNA ligase